MSDMDHGVFLSSLTDFSLGKHSRNVPAAEASVVRLMPVNQDAKTEWRR